LSRWSKFSNSVMWIKFSKFVIPSAARDPYLFENRCRVMGAVAALGMTEFRRDRVVLLQALTLRFGQLCRHDARQKKSCSAQIEGST
jgi:hypothetical protein